MAPTPLGPWKIYEKNPMLDYGSPGSWDEDSVDCVSIMKEGAYDIDKNRYYMWYSGGGASGRHIGLATAPHPLGPWKRHEGNPILEDFGYLGGVVKVKGKFYMYNQYPMGAADQGPYCLATAEDPTGPWKKYKGNPVLTPGDWGAWDDGGFSEARVRYHEGVFHCFYGGTKTPKLESIGYAYSFDGYNFTKYSGNPIISLNRVPDAAGFAEVHSLIEPPFVYLYHTLRYISKNPQDKWETEDLGIQVLSIDPNFRLSMSVLDIPSLEPNTNSELESSIPISFENASSFALSIECKYHPNAKAGLRIHVKSSYDGINYDTIDLYRFDIDFVPGESIRKTIERNPKVKFVKVTAENLDESYKIISLRVTATLGR